VVIVYSRAKKRKKEGNKKKSSWRKLKVQSLTNQNQKCKYMYLYPWKIRTYAVILIIKSRKAGTKSFFNELSFQEIHKIRLFTYVKLNKTLDCQ